MYVIASDVEGGFWSNRHGWVFDVSSATEFYPFEVSDLKLRLIGIKDARWVKKDEAADYDLT